MFAFFKRFQAKAHAAALQPDGFDALLVAHGSHWYAACLRITKDANLAEDALQEALIRAWDQRQNFRAQAELSTWVHRIAVNCAIDQTRRQRGDLSLEQWQEQQAPQHDGPTRHTDAIGPDHGSGALGFAGQLQSALTQLSELERVSFLLKHVEEYRLDEVADTMAISVDSVKQALFRATKKLRITLAPWQE
jgi:RNA polymerase sigma-70 factor, ECF subfamily